MKHLKRFFIALIIIVGIVLIAAIFLPSKIHIEASTTINTPANIIFPKVNSLKAWEEWSPFQKADPNMTSVYEGPVSGVGAKQIWKSEVNQDGNMVIEESTPNSYIKMKLGMMEGTTTYSDWKFEAEAMSTKVTWSVDISDLGYPVGRILGLIMPSMMKKSFQSGLEDLKKVAEAEYAKMMVYKTGDISVEEVKAWNALAVKDSNSCDKISEVMGTALGEVQEFITANKIECIGAPYAMYYLWDEKTNKFVMEAGLPVAGKIKPSGRILYKEYPATKVAKATHFGAYETLYFTYEAIEKYIKDNNLVQKGMPWEVYSTDPETQPDMAKWETVIYYPIEE